MTLAIILVVVALLALFLLLYLVRGRREGIESVEEMAVLLRPLDLEAFRNLTDADEETFLRKNLPQKEFRAVQRERLRAAAEYLAITAHNAAVLLRWGQAAHQSQDPNIAAEGRRLVDRAARLRLYSLLYLVKIRIALILPGASVSFGTMVENYRYLNGLAAQLTLLRQPKQVSRVTAILG